MARTKQSFLSLNRNRLKEWLHQQKEPGYRTDQILSWVYQQDVLDFSGMTNLPKQLRNKLDKNFFIPDIVIESRLESEDGTVKFLFKLNDNYHIEAVYIPHPEHYTLCISSQIGCAFKSNFRGYLGL